MAIQDDKAYAFTGEQLKDFAKRGGGADWEQEDPAGAGYIKHRPFYDTRFTFPYYVGEQTVEKVSSVPIDGVTWESDPQAYAQKLGMDFYSQDVMFFKVDSAVLFNGEKIDVKWSRHSNHGMMEEDNDTSGTSTYTVSVVKKGTEQKEFYQAGSLLIADDVACFFYGGGYRNQWDDGEGNITYEFYAEDYYYVYDAVSQSGTLHQIESKFLPKGTSNVRGGWSLTELDEEIRREEILDEADWNTQNPSSPSYIKNKPFGDTSVVYHFSSGDTNQEYISTNYEGDFQQTSFYQLYGRVIPCYVNVNAGGWNFQKDSAWNWATDATSDKWGTLTVGETFDIPNINIYGYSLQSTTGTVVRSFTLGGQTYNQLTGTQKQCKLATFTIQSNWGESTTGYLFITPTAILLAKGDDWYWDNTVSVSGTIATHGVITQLPSKYLPSAGVSTQGVASYTEMAGSLKGTYLKANNGKLDLRDSHIADWNSEYDTAPTFIANRPCYTDAAGHRYPVSMPHQAYGNYMNVLNVNHYYGDDREQVDFRGQVGTDYYSAGFYGLKADSALLAQLKTAAESGQAFDMIFEYSYHDEMDWSSHTGTVSEHFVFEQVDDNVYAKPFDSSSSSFWDSTQIIFGRWADVGTDLSASTPDEDDWVFGFRLSDNIGNGNIDSCTVTTFEIETLTDTVYKLDAKYIPVDGSSIYVDNGVLKSAGGGGGVSPEVLANYYTKAEIDQMFANLEIVTDVEF